MRASRLWAVIAVAFTVALLLTALAGCSPISEGYITAKVNEPANYYTTMVCGMYGKYGCTMWVPQLHYDDEDWRFDLAEQTDGLNGDEAKTGYIYVSHETFDAYEVGDYWEAAE